MHQHEKAKVLIENIIFQYYAVDYYELIMCFVYYIFSRSINTNYRCFVNVRM